MRKTTAMGAAVALALLALDLALAGAQAKPDAPAEKKDQLGDKWGGFVKPSSFDEYSKKYRDFFAMRRKNGIIELRMQTNGGPYVHSWAGHNAWNQAFRDVANDPENEVMILTGTGDKWFTADSAKAWDKPLYEESPDHIYQMMSDVQSLMENLVLDFKIPTIAAINGPGVHTEIALACDITLCADDADLFDPHFLVGAPPGDGEALVFQELMGVKRAAYYLYTSKRIDAQTALDLGLVNEVMKRDKLLPRAWEIAESIMQKTRIARRLTHAMIAQPWKQALVRDLGFQQMSQFDSMLIPYANGTEGMKKAMEKAGESKGW